LKKSLLHTILLLCSVVGSANLFGQIAETNYYYYKDRPQELIPIDTGLNNMEAYNFMITPTWDYFNLGNTGQAHQYLALDWNGNRGFKSGMTSFDQYKYRIDKIKYYKVEKPISEITYFMGSKRENIFGAKFAHNVKNRLNYGLDFHRVLSNGVYNNIRARNGNFDFYAQLFSKNNRYVLGAEASFSKLKSEENGGLILDFVNNPELAEPNKEFYAVNTAQGLTQHKNFQIEISNTYHFGFHTFDSINDSLAVRKFHPSFSISHATGTQKNTVEYVDKAADNSIYNDYFQAVDSTYYRLYYHQIPNRIYFSYSGLKAKRDSAQYMNLQAEAGAQHDNIELWQNGNEFTTNNLHVYGKIQGNPFSLRKWDYQASAYYYLTGYNQNDWHTHASFSYDFNQFGQLAVSGLIEQQEATWIEHSYASSSLNWENNFNKKTRSQIALDYTLSKHQFRIHAEYNTLGNFIYFDENSRAQQLNSTLSYYQAYASKALQFKILHFDNFIGVQGNNNQQALRLPKIFLKSSLYIEGYIFKGKMLGRFGADLRYNSNFAANAWNPIIGQFHIQNEQTMHYTPVLDVFVSFKVKTLRVFAKGNYLNEGLIKKNYYTALGYPDRGRTFAGGLIWRFFE
jgi:hypothetical protein